jgi:2-succinyl-6-hydroxy-2,4-cyclohexadiene-1-carboxylate synthase
MNKPHLIFLHGFLGNSHEFDSITPLLKDKFNCITLDLNSATSFSLKNMADYVRESLKKLNVQRAHFWGYSMGGRVLLELYRNYPEMCLSLTLESTSLGLKDPHERNNRIKMDSDWANLISTNAELFLEKWYSQVLFSSFKKHKDYSLHMKLREKTLSSTHSQMIMEASPGANLDHYEVMESISVPTLALVGQNDEKYLQIWGKLIDQNPGVAVSNNQTNKQMNIDLKTVENSGHVIHLENPIGATDAFLEFTREDLKELT